MKRSFHSVTLGRTGVTKPAEALGSLRVRGKNRSISFPSPGLRVLPVQCACRQRGGPCSPPEQPRPPNGDREAALGRARGGPRGVGSQAWGGPSGGGSSPAPRRRRLPPRGHPTGAGCGRDAALQSPPQGSRWGLTPGSSRNNGTKITPCLRELSACRWTTGPHRDSHSVDRCVWVRCYDNRFPSFYRIGFFFVYFSWGKLKQLG